MRETARVPVGYPPAGVSSEQRRYLDHLVDGTGPTPAVVDRLVLPPPTSWSYGRVTAEPDIQDDVTLTAGVVFGGYIGCLVDHFAGLAMMTVLPDGAGFLTAELAVRFAAPLWPGPVRIDATVSLLSRRQATVEVTFRQGARLTSTAVVEQVTVPRIGLAPAAATAVV